MSEVSGYGNTTFDRNHCGVVCVADVDLAPIGSINLNVQGFPIWTIGSLWAGVVPIAGWRK